MLSLELPVPGIGCLCPVGKKGGREERMVGEGNALDAHPGQIALWDPELFYQAPQLVPCRDFSKLFCPSAFLVCNLGAPVPSHSECSFEGGGVHILTLQKKGGSPNAEQR